MPISWCWRKKGVLSCGEPPKHGGARAGAPPPPTSPQLRALRKGVRCPRARAVLRRHLPKGAQPTIQTPETTGRSKTMKHENEPKCDACQQLCGCVIALMKVVGWSFLILLVLAMLMCSAGG